MSTLVSPGVSVTVIDQSQYASSGQGTVPLVVIATEANKLGTDGVTVTPGTQTSGVMTLLTSQLDLVTQFGSPVFEIDNGTVNQGSEISEYGLKAAFDYLGIANRAYVVRADIDLSQLAYSETAPSGKPVNGTYWFNLNTTSFGIFRANGNSTPGLAWTAVSPVIPTASEVDVNFVPLAGFGSNGNIAVVTLTTNNAVYEKISGAWYLIGSASWQAAKGATVALGTVVNPTLLVGDTIIIDGTSVSLTGTTLAQSVIDINNAAITNITASNVGNKLQLTDASGNTITIAGTSAVKFGLAASTAGYNFVYAPHTQVPVGTHSGDIWIKTTNPNFGANYVVELFSSSLNQFATITAPFYASDSAATAGYGAALSIGSLYVHYNAANNNTATQIIERWNGSAWDVLSYVASTTAPTTAPADGTLWISNEFIVDVMVNNGNEWLGYLNMYPATDPNGVQITSAQPTTQSTGNPLADQDLWLDSSDVVNYPALYRYSASSATWTLIDKTDLTTPFGIVFADARPNADGSVNGATEITNMLVSNFVDPDAPNPETYPAGLLLFNTRYSTYNVKSYDSTKFLNEGSYTVGAFTGNANSVTGTIANPTFNVGDTLVINGNTVTLTGTTLVDAIVTINNAAISNIVASDTTNHLTITNLANTTITLSGIVTTEAGLATSTAPVPALSAARWVTASGNDVNGTPFMGRFAQHQMVVEAINSLLESNDPIRSEFNFFNILTAPGYPEVFASLQALNIDRKETSFIITDTPMHLKADATSLNNWATNTANVANTNEFGRTTLYTYAAEYYPQGLGTDSLGNSVAVPASSIALCTYGYNDSVAYPWYSPAGTQRGVVQNATSVGYVDPVTNLFTPVTLNQGQRDTLYTNQINPIANLPNRGLIVYGDITLEPGDDSALDRINVARLVCYLRSQLDALAQPFLFQLNTESTRNSVEAVFSAYLGDLLSLQAVTDFAVVCDTTNNTPETIDANELWIDIAIVPSKSINFIYIPIRIMNTGSTL